MTQIMQRQVLLFFIATLFSVFASGQNLTAAELNSIQNNSDFASIVNSLENKGFTFQGKQTDSETRETVARWYFRPFTTPAEEVSASLVKSVDSNQVATTTFCLYSPFDFKNFIGTVSKSKYRFAGMRIIHGKNYSAFKKGRTVFLTRQQAWLDGQIFEILVHSE